MIDRQTGSHIRLSVSMGSSHYSITIPDHDDLKTGTLGSILHQAAEQLGITKNTIIDRIF
jgi:predicted RNA binding protein YcfA (HicA-like mRNA interferase family)